MNTIGPITWLLNLDATGAQQGLKDFVDQAMRGIQGIDQAAAQWGLSHKVWKEASSSVRRFITDAISDLNMVGNSATAVGNRINKSFGEIKFNDLKRNLNEIDHMLKQNVLTAEAAAAALNKINQEGARRQQAMASGRQTLGIVGGGLALTGMYAARSLYSLGMSGTGEETQGQFERHMLGREVASIFAPVSREMTHRVSEMTGWLQTRSKEDRQSYQSAGMFGMSAATMVPMLSITAHAMAQSFGASDKMAGGFGRAGGLLGLGVAALSSTAEGRQTLADLVKSFEPIMITFAHAVKELAPALSSFAKGIARLIPDKDSPSAIRGGALIGGGAGYAIGGVRGAAIGAIAGQITDKIGGEGAFGSLLGMLMDTPGGTARSIVSRPGAALNNWIHGTNETPEDFSKRYHDTLIAPVHNAASTVGMGWLVDYLAGGKPGGTAAGASDMNLSPTSRGFESAEGSWERLTAAAQQVDLQQQLVANTSKMSEAMTELVNLYKAQGMSPALARKIAGITLEE